MIEITAEDGKRYLDEILLGIFISFIAISADSLTYL
jgi:hypothetical protein